MTPTIVIDIGNSRIKWGWCQGGRIAERASLPPDDPTAWQGQLDAWKLIRPGSWVISSVQPKRRDRLVEWICGRGDHVLLLEQARQLPLQVLLEYPDRVGIDRLLNAVAAQAERQNAPAIIADAGSAVTVDWLDEAGAFRGGTILPGLRLMAQALHDHTALLPLVELRNPAPPVLGTSTPAAIEAGIFYGVAGAINTLIKLFDAHSPVRPRIFLTGGDAALLKECIDQRARLWPDMTLEGIRLAAEALP
jgi:type III pantothenate kinase